MTEQATDNKDVDTVEQDELTLLKERCDKLGIPYKSNTSAATLRKKLEEALKEEGTTEESEGTSATNKLSAKKAATRLVRVQITCMNERKREYPGEIFTVSNSVIGTVKRMVPYNGEPTHIEHVILEQLKEKKFTRVVPRKTEHGVTVKEFKQQDEFAIKILPDLTEAELKELATKQAAAGSIDK